MAARPAASVARARGSCRTDANGCAAFGQYRIDPDGGHAPWAVQVVEVEGDRISAFHAFVDPTYFTLFDLPDHLDD